MTLIIMHIYLMRHGESEENAQPWDGSNTNSPLTELGQIQVKALADWVAEHIQLEYLHASPMQRARQTVAPVAAALNINPIFDDRLCEVGNAYPDSHIFPIDRLPRYILGRWGSIHPYDPITEDGENWMQFRARIGGFIEWLIREYHEQDAQISVGVVCHGGVIEGVFEHVFHKGPVSAVVVNSNNTGITHLEYFPTDGMPAWKLHYHNWTRHLSIEQIT